MRNSKGQFIKGNHPKTEFKKGRKHGNRWYEIMREKMKGNTYGFQKGNKINLGRKRPDMSERQRGEKNYNWNNGSSFEPYSTDWTETLRRSIRERDNYICRLCGINQIEELEKTGRKLAVHHIDYDKKNCNPCNLITLCLRCHNRTIRNRDYWINYFTNR